jgi:NADH:ubiquinone oxidoreductase subunit H
MGVLILPVAMCTGSLDMASIVSYQATTGIWLAFPLFPIFILFIITILA